MNITRAPPVTVPRDRRGADAGDCVLTMPSQRAFCESGGPNNTVCCIRSGRTCGIQTGYLG